MFRKIINKNLTINSVRCYGKHNKKFLYKDGVQLEGVTYYPRDPNYVDPPIEPAKLFRVERIKTMKGAPFWEKRILKDLGIHNRLHEVTVVKNIPENNARLWKVKHLLKITPIQFPFGEPTMNDVDYTVLQENGDCIVMKELKIDDKVWKSTREFELNPTRLDADTLKKDSRLKWLNNW